LFLGDSLGFRLLMQVLLYRLSIALRGIYTTRLVALYTS
jgi:hypothetical protein